MIIPKINFNSYYGLIALNVIKKILIMKFILKFKFLYIFGFSLFLYGDVTVYSFDDLNSAMLKLSPNIISAKLNKELVKQESEQIVASFYPRINLSVSSQYSKKFNKNPYRYMIDSSLVSTDGYQNSLTLSMNYEIFKFGATSLNLQSSKQKEIAYKYKECNIKNIATLKLLEVYNSALDNKEQLNAYKELKEIYKNLYNFSKRLNEYGESSKSALAQSAIDLVETDDMILAFKQKYNEILAQISNLTTIDIGLNDKLLALDGKNKIAHLPKFEDTSKAKEINALIISKELQVKALKKEYLPTIYFHAKYDFYGENSDRYGNSLSKIHKNGYMFGISFVYNIFDGFERDSKIKNAYLQIALANESLREAKNDYDMQVRNLTYDIENLNDKIATIHKIQELSKDLVIANQRLYQNDEIDKISLLKSMAEDIQTGLELKMLENKKKMLGLKQSIISKFSECL